MTAEPLTTLIIDDEPLAVERLAVLAAREPRLSVAGTACDGEDALRLVRALAPQLLLLDIGMPGLDGMAVARAVRDLEPRPAIVFVTAFDNFAVDAFDLDVADYITKPVSAERLARAVDRVCGRMLQADAASPPADDRYAAEFWVPHRGELLRIAAGDIDRVEAERDYMRFHTGARSYLVHQTIAGLEERLDPACFLRIHRSHIVRRDFVTSLRHEGGGVWHVVLTDGTSLRIGRKYLAEAKALAGR